jgi:Ca2+-dependent lipid-binding protein
MKQEYRFYTEVKDSTQYQKPGTPNSYFKAPQYSMNDNDFNMRLPAFTPFKFLTIKIHEASLLVDVSLFGKMTSYANIILGNVKWSTNIDKEFHMNPKWNEVLIYYCHMFSPKLLT